MMRVVATITMAAMAITATARAADPAWVGSWAAAPMVQDKSTFSSPPALSGRTLRQTVHLSVGGRRVRVRLDNTFGERGLVVRSGTAGGVPLAFDGRPGVTVPAGALVWSDPVDLAAAAGSDLAVTLAFGDAPGAVTGHTQALASSYLSGGPTTGPATEPAEVKVHHWFVLDGVDVEADRPTAAVVALGDSITDGAHSKPAANHRWPDVLAARLGGAVGVLNEGISGNRLTDNGTGPGGLARFDRDVLGQTAVRWVVLLEGINDIGTDPDAASGSLVGRLELADEQVVARAHAHGLRAYGATILPFVGAGYAGPDKERNRQAVNAWIRTSGTFDAVVDLDAATRDPDHPDRLLPAYDCGDHLHPNDAGYRRMGEAFDPQLFAR